MQVGVRYVQVAALVGEAEDYMGVQDFVSGRLVSAQSEESDLCGC